MNLQEKWTFRWQISHPSQDPFLLLDWKNENLVMLFDCGLKVWGNVKTVLKLEHLFITHAHIDHLIGFDHIIRALLGEKKHLNIYGPRGIRDRLAAKLNGYDWDRAADQELSLEIHELDSDRESIQIQRCRERFQRTSEIEFRTWERTVVHTDLYQVEAVQTDHGGSPCLAYSITEFDHLRINKEKVSELGLKPGPWVGDFLRSISSSVTTGARFKIEGFEVDRSWLQSQIVTIQKGKKVTYITDTVFSPEVLESVSKIGLNSDIVFCESTFMNEDADLAAKYHHLTSRQAAMIANECSAKRLILFHISNRYHPHLYKVLNEAREIFPATDIAGGTGKPRHGLNRPMGDNEL